VDVQPILDYQPATSQLYELRPTVYNNATNIDKRVECRPIESDNLGAYRKTGH